MLVIGLGHKMRMGKDTLAVYLKETYGSIYDIRLYSFGKLLKDEINCLYEECGSWSETFSYIHHNIVELPHWVTIQHSAEEDPLCPYGKQRSLLQFWGTEYRRAQSPNYWVKALRQQLEIEQPQIAIITDVRFPNEYHWVKSLGRDGIMVKVERTGYVSNEAHVSETALDGYEFDYTVSANDIQELYDDGKALWYLIESRDRLPDGFTDFTI